MTGPILEIFSATMKARDLGAYVMSGTKWRTNYHLTPVMKQFIHSPNCVEDSILSRSANGQARQVGSMQIMSTRLDRRGISMWNRCPPLRRSSPANAATLAEPEPPRSLPREGFGISISECPSWARQRAVRLMNIHSESKQKFQHTRPRRSEIRKSRLGLISKTGTRARKREAQTNPNFYVPCAALEPTVSIPARLGDIVLGSVGTCIPPNKRIDHLVRYLSTWSGSDLVQIFPVPEHYGTSGVRVFRFMIGIEYLTLHFCHVPGLLPIIQWLSSLERSQPQTRKLLNIERLQALAMLAYYPLEHAYYLGSQSIIRISPSTSNKLVLWSCRVWAVYIVLQFEHLREDMRLLAIDERAARAARKSGEVTAEASTSRVLTKRKAALWNQVLVNLGNFPLALHWSLEKGLFGNEVRRFNTRFGLISLASLRHLPPSKEVGLRHHHLDLRRLHTPWVVIHHLCIYPAGFYWNIMNSHTGAPSICVSHTRGSILVFPECLCCASGITFPCLPSPPGFGDSRSIYRTFAGSSLLSPLIWYAWMHMSQLLQQPC
ncbi:PEX11 domain-containing protein [Rhizoctonia solani AG-1 IA]|uniref:PEX11 domain-containing protein n=1 Tax=Thanatephorus cucumeris (strain AG1-IA) TaxID=983506 RepID=L8WUT2_THACA|nr:PEX11 domain-containing protein [Rhizoctonia solani AG-1 IA]